MPIATKKKTTKNANGESKKKAVSSEWQIDARAKARIAATRAVFAVLDKQQKAASLTKQKKKATDIVL